MEGKRKMGTFNIQRPTSNVEVGTGGGEGGFDYEEEDEDEDDLITWRDNARPSRLR
jgi:hypothetical protein